MMTNEFDVFDKLSKEFPNDKVKELSSNNRGSEIIIDIKSKETVPRQILIHYKKAKGFHAAWRTKLNTKLLSNSFGIIVYKGSVSYDSIEYKRIITCMPEELVCTVGVIKKLLASNAIKSK